MEGSRLQIASLRRIKGVGEYPGIGGRIKSEWVGALNRKRWAHHPGIRTEFRDTVTDNFCVVSLKDYKVI